jgi:hypothetical protein
MKPHKINTLPYNTLITNGLSKFDYWDSYIVVKNTSESIGAIKSRVFALPVWVTILLKLRNNLFVKPFGLNTGSHEIPTLFISKDEIVAGEDDKHLYFRISVLKKENHVGAEIYLTTIVKFNNRWGRLYFTLIKPFHKVIVKTLLKRI